MKIVNIIICSLLIISAAGCTSLKYDDVHAVCDERRIYLYGESHGQEIILQKEVELWETYYNLYGLRHLFLESSYAEVQFLNIWMKQEDNHILDQLHENHKGTMSYTQANYDFYIEIKKRCPETIFHGTDVCHQFDSTGESYILYLKEKGLTDTDEYRINMENIGQALKYYAEDADYDTDAYRENAMVENFIREFDSLPAGEKIMGIYGSLHTNPNGKSWKKGGVPSMANQLTEYYRKKENTEIFTCNISSLKR